MGTASLPVLQRQKKNRPQSLKAQWPPLHATSPLPASDPFKNHSFLFKEGQKYINKSNKEPLVLPKGGKKKTVPTSCLWKKWLIPLPGTLPMGSGEGSLLTQFLTSPPGRRAEVVGRGSNKEALFDQRKIMSSQKDQG